MNILYGLDKALNDGYTIHITSEQEKMIKVTMSNKDKEMENISIISTNLVSALGMTSIYYLSEEGFEYNEIVTKPSRLQKLINKGWKIKIEKDICAEDTDEDLVILRLYAGDKNVCNLVHDNVSSVLNFAEETYKIYQNQKVNDITK
ncbi:MAG: hypothetical protein E7351_03270 [Clostridiales bacterium]|nr:hypothetical protein [Clostridiales bacterium]